MGAWLLLDGVTMETFSTHARKHHKIYLVSIKERNVLTKSEYFTWVKFFKNNSLLYDSKLKCKVKYCCVPLKKLA